MNCFRHAIIKYLEIYNGETNLFGKMDATERKRVAPKDHPGWRRVSDPLITGPLQRHQGGKVRKHV